MIKKVDLKNRTCYVAVVVEQKEKIFSVIQKHAFSQGG